MMMSFLMDIVLFFESKNYYAFYLLKKKQENSENVYHLLFVVYRFAGSHQSLNVNRQL